MPKKAGPQGTTRNRAVFLDRDGVLNDLVYDEEEGKVTSPVTARQLRVASNAAETVRALRDDLGFKVIVISNQPGVAKRQFTLAELGRMNGKIRRALTRGGAKLDGEYYCLHHPEGVVRKYRVVCDCRKPKPGLLLRAAAEHDIDLATSYFVGDGLVDVEAGKRAGCRTILVGHATTFFSEMMEKRKATPDYMVASFKDLPSVIREIEPSR